MSDLVGNPEDRFSHKEAQMTFASENLRLMVSVCMLQYVQSMSALFAFAELSKNLG